MARDLVRPAELQVQGDCRHDEQAHRRGEGQENPPRLQSEPVAAAITPGTSASRCQTAH